MPRESRRLFGFASHLGKSIPDGTVIEFAESPPSGSFCCICGVIERKPFTIGCLHIFCARCSNIHQCPFDNIQRKNKKRTSISPLLDTMNIICPFKECSENIFPLKDYLNHVENCSSQYYVCQLCGSRELRSSLDSHYENCSKDRVKESGSLERLPAFSAEDLDGIREQLKDIRDELKKQGENLSQLKEDTSARLKKLEGVKEETEATPEEKPAE